MNRCELLVMMRYYSAIVRRPKVLIISCLTLIYITWLELQDSFNETDLIKEVHENIAKDLRYIEIYKKKKHLSKDLKFILLWTPKTYSPFYYYGSGQEKFIENNCPHTNCYVTDDRMFFGNVNNVTKFDAVLFNGRNLDQSDLPKKRSSHQKYVYVMMESAANIPICTTYFNNFFNWTATYRLDSDIPMTYFNIKNSKGEIIGPKDKMEWIDETFDDKDYNFHEEIRNKRRLGAWFVSHCKTRGKRETYVESLNNELSAYGQRIDIYGSCGSRYISDEERNRKLRNDYYFYLAFENSAAADYVSEKVLIAMQNEVVPIVFGGADYSRFLPAGSYINAKNYSPKRLANLLYKLMINRDTYSQFFRWKKHYTYFNSEDTVNVCKLSEALNNEKMVKTHKTYQDIRSWWLSDYIKSCHGFLYG